MSQPTQNQAADPAATARTLWDAALYLGRYGWIQGAYYDATAVVFTPAACLVGAIAMVCYGGPVEAPAQHFGTPEFDAFDAAVSYLDSYLGREHGVCCYEFNDTTGRTASEVLDALHQAADELDRPAVVHEGLPHRPGQMLHGCPACLADCFCTDEFVCAGCVAVAEGGDAA